MGGVGWRRAVPGELTEVKYEMDTMAVWIPHRGYSSGVWRKWQGEQRYRCKRRRGDGYCIRAEWGDGYRD